MNNIDPNWFFSATAQSFAAIVAIIGGFILSRILSLRLKDRDLSLRIKELKCTLDNKKNHYKTKISEWRKIILEGKYYWDSYLRNKLEKGFNEINLISSYQDFKEKIKDFIIFVNKMELISCKIAKSKKIPQLIMTHGLSLVRDDSKFNDPEKIKKEIIKNKESFIDIFKKNGLTFDNDIELLSHYIAKQYPNGIDISNLKNLDNKILELKNIINSKGKIVKQYNEFFKDKIESCSFEYFLGLERDLDGLWEEKKNLEDEKKVCENGIKSIEIEKNESLSKIKKPIILLFGFGVISPLIALFLDFIFRKYSYNFYYGLFLFNAILITISGIIWGIIESIKYFKDI